MLSYNDWKQYNESFGPAVTLGLKSPSALGGVVGAQNIDPELMDIEEGKKKSKKKMLDLDIKPGLKIKPKSDKALADDDDIVKLKPRDDEEVDDEEVDDEEVDDEEADDEEVDGDEDGDEEVEDEVDDEPKMFAKKKAKKCAKKCASKKMKKEEKEWWNSVHDMMDASKVYSKRWDGLSEDLLISPQEGEPKPGDPGFAPQTRIGSL